MEVLNVLSSEVGRYSLVFYLKFIDSLVKLC